MRSSRRTSLVLAVLLWAALPAAAQKSGEVDDPFSEANKAVPKKAAEKPAEKPAVVPKLRRNPTDDRIEFEVDVSPKQARRGETVKLTIIGTPQPGFHTYPLTQRTPAQAEIGLSKIEFKDAPGLKPLQPVMESDAVLVRIEELGTYELEHKDRFTWVQDILVLPDATPGTKSLRFAIKLQVCDERGCVPGEPAFDVPVTVTDAPPVPLSAELKQRLDARPSVRVVAAPGAAPSDKEDTPAKGTGPAAAGPQKDSGWLAFILQGISFGFISLLTPCVFPMIPITVSFFLKQSEKQHHRPITMASVYSGTIVVVLTVGGVLLIRVLQPFSQHWVTNGLLGVLFLVFALSLFGWFDITLPSGLANLTSAQEGRGGLLGVMFMALTFTIISFTCVAPFYGGFIALAGAAQSVADYTKLSLGALAFSAAFASPFFVLALFPNLLRSMPKSGSWMNTIKVVMGFLELAAALKFLRAAELRYFAGATFFTYDLVLGMYVAIAVLCGLYLLNLYRLPHDHDVPEQLGVPRLLFSAVFLSLGLYLLPGLFKTNEGEQQRPSGSVFSWLDSFLLPDARHDIAWAGNLEKGLQNALDKRRLVFIDFTGLT